MGRQQRVLDMLQESCLSSKLDRTSRARYGSVDIDSHEHTRLTVLSLGAVEPQSVGVVDGNRERGDHGHLTFLHVGVPA